MVLRDLLNSLLQFVLDGGGGLWCAATTRPRGKYTEFIISIESKFLALLISRGKREIEWYFPREAGREARQTIYYIPKSLFAIFFTIY